MWQQLKRWWPVLKALLAVAILVGVGWQFVGILRDPRLHDPEHQRSPGRVLLDWFLAARPEWLVLSAVFYVGGLCFSATFWVRLLRSLGQRPALPAAVRAYWIGHLGKYIPGKAWALLLRTTLISGPDVRPGVAALTAAYETLTTMAAGALLAAVLFTWQASESAELVWRALGLLALAGIPILPGIFNRLVRRISAPFLKADAAPLPPLPGGTLLLGLGMTACGWTLLGASLWAAVQALQPESPAWAWETWLRYTAFIALSYVAGFLALPAPGGLGVREFLLQQMLAPELGPLGVAVVLLLRLLWTAAELVMAAAVYWLPGPRKSTTAPSS